MLLNITARENKLLHGILISKQFIVYKST